MNDDITTALKDQFQGKILDSHAFRGDETVVVRGEALRDIAAYLRDEEHFEFLMDLTAADYPGRTERFELVCHFYSLSRNKRLRLKVPVGGENPSALSLTGLWGIADWLEREVYDMFGIKFEGHPDLKRILMYDEFQGHPLRKDYPRRGRQPRIPHEN